MYFVTRSSDSEDEGGAVGETNPHIIMLTRALEKEMEEFQYKQSDQGMSEVRSFVFLPLWAFSIHQLQPTQYCMSLYNYTCLNANMISTDASKTEQCSVYSGIFCFTLLSVNGPPVSSS